MKKMPSKLSTWFLILYFLFAGIAAFGVFALPEFVTGILALGAAVFLFLDR